MLPFPFPPLHNPLGKKIEEQANVCIYRVNALYYVTFTTSTLTASFILNHGFNTSSTPNMISLLSGFLLNFMGVYLLMMSKSDFDEGLPSEEGARFQILSESFAESVLSFGPGSSRRSEGCGREREAMLGKEGDEDGNAEEGIELRHFQRTKGEHA